MRSSRGSRPQPSLLHATTESARHDEERGVEVGPRHEEIDARVRGRRVRVHDFRRDDRSAHGGRNASLAGRWWCDRRTASPERPRSESRVVGCPGTAAAGTARRGPITSSVGCGCRPRPDDREQGDAGNTNACIPEGAGKAGSLRKGHAARAVGSMWRWCGPSRSAIVHEVCSNRHRTRMRNGRPERAPVRCERCSRPIYRKSVFTPDQLAASTPTGGQL